MQAPSSLMRKSAWRGALPEAETLLHVAMESLNLKIWIK